MLDEFVTAFVCQPFGLEGFVKIRSVSGETEHLLVQKQLTLRSGSGRKSYRVEASKISGDGVLRLKFAGIDTPEAARALKGMEILVSRAAAAPLKENEFYIEDLKGLAVVNTAGCVLGTIENVLEGGGGDLVDVRLQSGETKLVPFRGEFFGDVDLAAGKALLYADWFLES